MHIEIMEINQGQTINNRQTLVQHSRLDSGNYFAIGLPSSHDLIVLTV